MATRKAGQRGAEMTTLEETGRALWPAGREAQSRAFWTVLYDGDCGLCRALLAGLLAWDKRRRLRPLPLQNPAAAEILAELPPAERLDSWHLLSPAGERWSAGAALAPLLRLLPGGRAAAAACARFPGPSERGYRWVAAHRSRLSPLLPARLKRRADRSLAARAAAVRPGQAAAPPAR